MENGKFYNNEKRFAEAFLYLQQTKSEYALWGWPYLLSLLSKRYCHLNIDNDKQNVSDDRYQSRTRQEEGISAMTPIILSGILTNLDDTATVTSTELVNYCVRMRRVALVKVRGAKKRDRILRICNPLLFGSLLFFVSSYSWRNLKLSLIGFYGLGTSDNEMQIPQVFVSSCRSINKKDKKWNNYTTACKLTEAITFDLLTSTNNNYHSTMLSALDQNWNNGSKLITLQKNLMQPDDSYNDDTELPIYALHTLLDDESSIPLDYVINNRHGKPNARHRRRRWRNRRKLRDDKVTQYENWRKGNSINENSMYGSLPEEIQFWGDTVVNRLVRESITKMHYNDSRSTKSGINSKRELKLLDVGSGMAGTLFSLCTPEFPFEDWSYHGIAISQPEVRRAKQLVEIFIHPKLLSRNHMNDRIVSSSSNATSTASSIKHIPFPLTNVTIERSSFDDALPAKEFTAIIAIESLSYSRNLTKTLVNLATSLKHKGTLIVIDDVVAPWVGTNDDKLYGMNIYNDIQQLVELTGKKSLLTHKEWLESFSQANLKLSQPPRDLLLEFYSVPVDSTRSSKVASIVTGLPFLDQLFKDFSRYTIGYEVMNIMTNLFRLGNTNDAGNIFNRALSLMHDLKTYTRGSTLHKCVRDEANLGYYMYTVTKY